MQGADLCIRQSPCKSSEWKKEMKMGSQQVQRPYRSTVTPGVSPHINWCHMLMSLIKIHGDNAQVPHRDNLQMQILNNSHTCGILFCSSYLPGSHVLLATSTLSDRHCIWSSQHHISQMLKVRFAKSPSPHQLVLKSILPSHQVHIS
jgi:hypothetical protein